MKYNLGQFMYDYHTAYTSIYVITTHIYIYKYILI